MRTRQSASAWLAVVSGLLSLAANAVPPAFVFSPASGKYGRAVALSDAGRYAVNEFPPEIPIEPAYISREPLSEGVGSLGGKSNDCVRDRRRQRDQRPRRHHGAEPGQPRLPLRRWRAGRPEYPHRSPRRCAADVSHRHHGAQHHTPHAPTANGAATTIWPTLFISVAQVDSSGRVPMSRMPRSGSGNARITGRFISCRKGPQAKLDES